MSACTLEAVEVGDVDVRLSASPCTSGGTLDSGLSWSRSQNFGVHRHFLGLTPQRLSGSSRRTSSLAPHSQGCAAPGTENGLARVQGIFMTNAESGSSGFVSFVCDSVCTQVRSCPSLSSGPTASRVASSWSRSFTSKSAWQPQVAEHTRQRDLKG